MDNSEYENDVANLVTIIGLKDVKSVKSVKFFVLNAVALRDYPKQVPRVSRCRRESEGDAEV